MLIPLQVPASYHIQRRKRKRRSFTLHSLNGLSTSLYESIEGCSGEVTLLQMTYHFPSLRKISLQWVKGRPGCSSVALPLRKAQRESTCIPPRCIAYSSYHHYVTAE